MNKEKFLLRLNQEIETLKAHVNRLKPAGYNIYPLDMELLRKKATELYDLMLQFEMNPVQKPEIQKESEVPDVIKREEPIQTTVTKEPPAKTLFVEPETKVNLPLEVEKSLAEDVFVQKEEEKKTIPEPQIEKPIVQTPVEKPTVETPVAEKIPKPNLDFDFPDKKPDTTDILQEKPNPAKTTLDLFSTVSDQLVAHRLSETGSDNSLAGKIQKEKLQNIRSAIGINEKFLFVNELFKGDIARYNRVIDELNAMQTKQGAETYLMEIKIEGQFGNEHEAFIKLKEIVDRKY